MSDMRMIEFSARRLTVLGIALVGLPLFGCGGEDRQADSGRTPVGQPGIASDPAGAPVGPRDIGRNLEELISDSSPDLADISVTCPARESLSGYPFHCDLVAADGRAGTPVSGEVSVIGVYQPTGTYAFEITYGPAPGD